MSSAFDLLTVPGTALLNLFLDADGDREIALRNSIAPWVGAVFWLTLLLIVRSAGPIARVLGLRSSPIDATQKLRWPRVEGFEARDAWAAAWRAQLVHVGLYLGLPLIWEAGRWVLIVAFLPIMIIGFGDTHIAKTDGTLDHLRSPACWTFATPCGGPRSNFLYRPVMDLSRCSRADCLEGTSILRDYRGWGWKALWLVISAAWIGWWWRSRRVSTEAIAGSRDP
jgi:hypothetical protein